MRRNRRIAVVSIVAVSTVLGIGIGLVVYAARGQGTQTEVPDVEGLTFEQAGLELKAVGLQIEINPDHDVSLVKIEGKQVGRQTPATGARAEKGSVVTVSLMGVPYKAAVTTSTPGAQTAPTSTPGGSDSGMSPPTDVALLFPFVKDASIACGHWPPGSQDYPYFGAPRNNNSRTHAGVDIYPGAGRGAPVRAIKDGTVLKAESFYTRADGEVTYGVLVDHGDFVANYAELEPPSITVGTSVTRNQPIGTVSGTQQLHFEQYAAGTKDWTAGWFKQRPSNLLDPTELMLDLYGL